MSVHQIDGRRYPVPGQARPFRLSFSASGLGLVVDQIKMIFLFIVAVITVYFAPAGLSKIVFPVFIILFWFSKKNFFWIAFFFVLAENPASFFSDWSRDALHRIPMYNFLPGLSFSVLDLFVVVALLKASLRGNRRKLAMKTPYLLMVGYLLFAVIISVSNSAGIGTVANAIRGPFYYALLLPVFYLINSKREAYAFVLLIVPFSIFSLFTQLYQLTARSAFINVLSPGLGGTVFIEGTQEIRALASGVLIIYFTFIFSLFLLENKEKTIKPRSLLIFVGASLVSIILSATRTWFVVFSVVLFGYASVSKKNVYSLFRIMLVLGLLIVLLIGSGLISKEFLLEGPMKRLGGTASLFKGDLDSVPTFKGRYVIRLPRVLEGIKGHLLIGCGFTEHYYRYSDYHVGFFNTILQFGLIGLSFFIYFFASYLLLLQKTVTRLSRGNPFKTSLKVLSLGFAGMLVAHFTIWYFFPMDSTTGTPFFVAVFLGLTEFFIREARREEEKA